MLEARVGIKIQVGLISEMQDGYGIDKVVNPVPERMHSLGEF